LKNAIIRQKYIFSLIKILAILLSIHEILLEACLNKESGADGNVHLAFEEEGLLNLYYLFLVPEEMVLLAQLSFFQCPVTRKIEKF